MVIEMAMKINIKDVAIKYKYIKLKMLGFCRKGKE